ncbi:MAG: rhomboid family intramembrane serine protease [Bacilli bacterium]|nr:rhomboid family intramembrane serine protease [Bacilli bacterium]
MELNLLKYLDYFSYNSVVILSYFFLCLLTLILNNITHDKINNFLVFRRGSLLNPMTYIRLIASGLCHKNWTHFRNNFITILLIGPILEEKYGSINLLYMLLITTFASSLVHLFIYDGGAIGASDNVYMLIVLCSIVNIVDGKIPITLILIILFYIVDEIIKQFSHKNDNISHDSHLVGAICGFIFGYFVFAL